MSRFDHLELGDSSPAKPQEAPAEAGLVDASFYLEKAGEAFDSDNCERALSFFSRALEYDISLEDAWLGQIRCLIELWELREAVVWTNRALQRFPNSARILAARAVAESRLGYAKAALGFSDSAHTAPGDWPYLWVARGEVLIPVNASKAKACFTKAIEMSPQDWAVRAWIGRSYAAHNCHHQALTHLGVAVRLDPARFACWYWIGQSHQALGEVREAKDAYRRAIAAEPSFAKAKVALRRIEVGGGSLFALWTRLMGFGRRMIRGDQHAT